MPKNRPAYSVTDDPIIEILRENAYREMEDLMTDLTMGELIAVIGLLQAARERRRPSAPVLTLVPRQGGGA